MKISFIMNLRIPTEKAHGYQIAKMCEALAMEGVEVSLVVPTRKNEAKGDIFSYYSVRNNFNIEYVPTFDAIYFFGASKFGFYLQALSFIYAIRLVSIPKSAIVVTRNPSVACWYAEKKYKVYYDAHNFPVRGQWVFKIFLKKVYGIIANSKGTARAFISRGYKNVLVAPNGVDLSHFSNASILDRNALDLPGGKIAMYAGHLYEWKGIDVVIESAKRSAMNDLTFIFVGGTEKDISHYKKRKEGIKNIILLEHRSQKEIATLISLADVLLLPNIASTKESVEYMSPIKMFEYMASGVPIVASDLPSIREILNEKNAILVRQNDPDALLRGISAALFHGKDQARCAKIDAQKYTWESRASTVIDFLKNDILKR